MATIHGKNEQEKVSINRFFGIFETEDGDTGLKNGVASEMENFEISENYHLRTRPGIATVPDENAGGYHLFTSGEIRALGNGYCGGKRFVAAATSQYFCVRNEQTGKWDTEVFRPASRVLMFQFAGAIYLITDTSMHKVTVAEAANGAHTITISEVDGYVPLVVTGAAPSGGGTTLERINLLTGKRRVQYSADGTSASYKLPETAGSLIAVSVDNADKTNKWALSQDGKSAAVLQNEDIPPQGVNNVEITYEIASNTDNRNLILGQRFCEAFNGPTDTRIFLGGDGSNILYYSGVTEAGAPSAEYFPALNEIRVDASNSPVTGLARHYTRLLVFKPDCTYSVGYETTYLADGTATAGFRLVPMHRELGSSAPGQVVTVKNFARTYCRGNLYDWKQTASYYQDERYAKTVSGPVQRSLRKTDASSIYLFDDDRKQRFFCFLNDADGTVLVNDYELDVWYKWTGFHDVHHMTRGGDDWLLFSGRDSHNGSWNAFMLRGGLSYDYIQHNGAWERRIIPARWESGHMSFGSESTRKYSSYIWATLLAGPGAVASLTARTDRRAEYAVKTDYANTTGLFDAVDFARFSFETYLAPFAKRLKLKVKKFVYYKLIITNDDPLYADPMYPRVFPTWADVPSNDGGVGCVCVLNVDIKLRRTSDAK